MSKYHRAARWGSENVTRMRHIVWATYEHTCFICELPIDTFQGMEVDHEPPISRGGDPWDIGGMRPTHMLCNRRKGNKSISEFKQYPTQSRTW